MTTTNTTTNTNDPDRIANDHGCDLQPSGCGGTVIVVQGYYAQGEPQDGARIRECRQALKAAGITPWEGHRGPVRVALAPDLSGMVRTDVASVPAPRRLAP